MNIATALNRKYLEYTVVMLCSLCENNNEHIDAYLLHSELTTQDIDIIKNSLSKSDLFISTEIIVISYFDKEFLIMSISCVVSSLCRR